MKNIFERFLALALTIIVCAGAASATTLIPGGQVIGLRLEDDTVTVAGFHEVLGDAAKSAGISTGDRIVAVDGTPIKSVADVRQALEQSDGTVDISFLRDGKAKCVTIAPAATDQGPKLGVYLRQGTSGLGTVTFYDVDSDRYGALGHGVNSTDGSLLKLHSGNVYEAEIFSVKKGAAGAPGQLLGQLTKAVSVGTVEKNTNRGVFGTIADHAWEEPLPIGEACVGNATIRSTVDAENLREYSVEILKIYPNGADKTRNLLLRVTDRELLQKTGGIVQGMSGSPIIQDGKLIGAVTHVLVNDPTTGYGIFIENMLDAAA
jgi:stage IV sporulation protein B